MARLLHCGGGELLPPLVATESLYRLGWRAKTPCVAMQYNRTLSIPKNDTMVSLTRKLRETLPLGGFHHACLAAHRVTDSCSARSWRSPSHTGSSLAAA